MKTLILATVLFFGAPLASFSGVILPNLYAREFCSLRAMGVSNDEAVTAAISESYLDNGETAPKVTINGTQYDSDVVRAYRTAKEQCPQHL